MENNPKKSKALIITIIAIILLVIIGYLIFKNRDVFGVKTSDSITKIFSPLISSKNSTDLNTTDENSTKALAQAGEDIKKGDSVSVFGTGANSNGNPIVVKSGSKGSNSSVFGFANQDITNGNIGEFTIKSGGSNNFFKSFSSFLGGIFNNNPPTIVPTNPPNPYQCTKDGVVIDCSFVPTNPPNPYQCTKDGVVIDCSFVPINPPNPYQCTKDGVVIDCSFVPTNPPNPYQCTKDGVVIDCSFVPTNPPNPYQCTKDGVVIDCSFVPINPPNPYQCTKDGVVIDCSFVPTNPPNPYQCTKDGVVIDCSFVPINPPNPYQCTKDGVVIDCSFVPINPPNPNICSLPRITDTDTGQCIDPSQCILPKIIVENKCENPSIGGEPDLRAGNVTPTNTTINTPTTLYSMITNDGGGGTMHSFSSFFAITITGKTNVELSVVIPTLEAKTANEAKVLYSFSSAGVYSIRACADKKSENDAGTVAESNENNNCGPWITFTVTNSLPTTGNGDITPPVITPPKDITPPPAIEVNKCLVIEQNPLTFTPEEKARLAVLLRKFYLISSTLKTTEDITTIYNEIEQQKNFITQIEDLTKQCYCQVNGIASLGQVGCKNLMMENPSWAQHGNPWYEKTFGGSFPYTNENSGYLNPASIDDANTERILNIW